MNHTTKEIEATFNRMQEERDEVFEQVGAIAIGSIPAKPRKAPPVIPQSAIRNPQWLVRWTGNYAVQFHCRGFSVVADEDATLFATEAEARAKALATATLHSYRGGQFTVEKLTPRDQPDPSDPSEKV